MADAAEIISLTTILSLSAVLSIFFAAFTASRTLLPSSASSKVRILFIWHFFDALIHFCLEGSFLYNCFFTSLPISAIPKNVFSLPLTPPEVYFLGKAEHLHGAFYGLSPTAKLWQEYAKADRRWGGSDLTVISLELLTVFVMGPLAVYICTLLRKEDYGRAWFWMIFVATGELYGGFMTFAPEWLSGNPNLDGTNFMYMWVYLFFMNMLWVFIPGWVLYEAYSSITASFANSGLTTKSTTKKTA